MSDVVKVAVIGDPHFVSKEGQNTKEFYCNNIDDLEKTPWGLLKSHIKHNNLKADLLICVGDMTTFADRRALETCWEELCSLAVLLGAEALISTTGNHDVSLVVSEQPPAKGSVLRQAGKRTGLNENLKSLNPPFPIVGFNGSERIPYRELRTQYFGESLTKLDVAGCSVFSFNSCAEHDSLEQDRGTFPRSSQDNLKYILEKNKLQQVSIFVLHHPIASEPGHASGPYDYVQNGIFISEMLERLSSQWLILHGHKHFRKLSYAQGGRNSPVIFSASSLGVPSIDTADSPHQFYIIELSSDSDVLKGKISIWKWALGTHWSNTKTICGFGDSRPAQEWARMINAFFIKEGQDELEWQRVEARFKDDFPFVLQQDKEKIIAYLRKHHSLILMPPDYTVLCGNSSGV